MASQSLTVNLVLWLFPYDTEMMKLQSCMEKQAAAILHHTGEMLSM